MATDIGQYSPVFLPGEPPLWQRSLAGHSLQRVAKSWTGPKWPCAHKHKTFFFFFVLWQLCPVRVEAEGSAAAWLAGTLVVTSVQGHKLHPWQELWPYQSLFQAPCSWWPEGLFGQYFSVAPPLQALRGIPCPGSFSVVPRVRHIDGLPWLVDQCIRLLKWHSGLGSTLVQHVRPLLGQPLYCSTSNASVWRARGDGDGSTAYAWLSSMPCFHGCLAFLHRYFPPQSPPSHPLHPSLCSQQQPSHRDCSTIPKLQLTAAAPSRRHTFLPGIWMATSRTVWSLFH